MQKRHAFVLPGEGYSYKLRQKPFLLDPTESAHIPSNLACLLLVAPPYLDHATYNIGTHCELAKTRSVI